MKYLITTLIVIFASVLPTLAQDPQDGFQTYFTPDTNLTPVYIAWLEKHAFKTLYVADFTFTSQSIVDEYCKLSSLGVQVHIILDKLESNAVKKEAALIKQLKQANIEVVITTSPKKGAIMHNKYSIADGQWVESGSFNYTDIANFQSNFIDFNIEPSPKRATLFMANWQSIYDFAKGK